MLTQTITPNLMSNQNPAQIYRHQFTNHESDPSPLGLAIEPPPWRKFSSKPTHVSLSTVEARAMEPDQVAKGRNYIADPEEAPVSYTHLTLPTKRIV